MILDLSQYSVAYLMRHSLRVKNDDLQTQCNAHTNNSCKIRKSYSPWTTIHKQTNFNKLCLILKMTSSRAKVPSECITKQFTDSHFSMRETIIKIPAWIESSNSFTNTKWKF